MTDIIPKRTLACAAFLALAFVVVALSGSASAAVRIGQISHIQNAAEAVTEGETRILSVNADVHLNDVITTGKTARIEITFADGTRVTLGENARLVIDDFVYAPAGDRSSINLAIKGAFRFITGLAGRKTHRQIAVHTPFAIIGVRGTDFFGGPIDNQFGVLLFDGAVEVTGGQGSAILDRAGQGTNIAAAGQPPGPVTIWPQDKVARALTSVALQ